MNDLQSIEIARIKGKISKMCKQLFSDALELNSDDFHVFVDFSGHTNSIDIDVYIGGWDRDKDNKVKAIKTYLDPLGSDRNDDIQRWQDILDELTSARKQLLNLKQQVTA